MIRIGICDDNERQVTALSQITAEFFKSRKIEYKISEVTTGAELLEDAEKYDIIFLDVVLKNGEDGIEVGKRLRGKNKVAKIIYVTLYEKYRIPAADTYAFNFVPKPAKKERIIELLEMAVSYIVDEPDSIYLEHTKKIYCFKKDSIVYAKSESHGISIYVEGDEGTYHFNYTLSDIARMLGKAGEDFVAIHRSYIVNMKQIRSTSNAESVVIMNNGHVLQIAQRKEFEFKKLFRSFVRRGERYA